jgi:hypothetical protein
MNRKTRTARTAALVLALAAVPALAADKQVFSDDFSDSSSGWVDTQQADHKAKGIALYDGSGGYQMTPVDDTTYGVIRAPRQAAGADVRVEANLFLYTGVGQGTGGLVCRHADNQNFYAFMVSGGHGYAIMKIVDGEATTLTSGRFEGAMPNIADVRIGASCKGDELTLSIDDEVVAEASDSDLGKGASGLIVMGEKMAGTSAVFDNFALYESR